MNGLLQRDSDVPVREQSKQPFGDHVFHKTVHEETNHRHRAESAVRDNRLNARIPAPGQQRCNSTAANPKDHQRQAVKLLIRLDKLQSCCDVRHFIFGHPVDGQIAIHRFAFTLIAKVE